MADTAWIWTGLAAAAAAAAGVTAVFAVAAIVAQRRPATPPYTKSPRFILPILLLNQVSRFVRAVFGVRLFSIQLQPILTLARSAPKSPIFGPQDELERSLAILVPGLQTRPLSFLGSLILKGMINRQLTVRKDVMEYVVKNPSIAQLPIAKPLIVLGLPRTGSTLLYNLLACDPTTRAPMFYEMIHFVSQVPPVPKAQQATDPRIEAVNKRFSTLNVLAPGMVAEMSKSHVTKALIVDEELVLMMHQLQWILYCPTSNRQFEDWIFDANNKAHVYVYLKRYLQMLQSAWAPESHWVLKSPVHALYLDALLKEFPDARIVVTHRELESVVPSLAKYIESQINYYFDDGTLSRKELGRLVTRLTDEVTNRMIEYRRAHPKPGQFCDVQYADMIKDPIPVVQAVYRHFGMEVSAEHERRMRQYMADNPQGKHGRASYEASDYGLDKEAMRKRYSTYLNTYMAGK